MHMHNYEECDILPRSHKPSGRAGTQVMGLSNNVGDFDIKKCVPNWNAEGHPIEADETLMEYIQHKTAELRSLIRDNPAKVGKKKPKRTAQHN